MIKLYIYKQERQRLANIFRMFQKENCHIYLTPEKIEFSSSNQQGSINKNIFIDYNVKGSKHLKLPSDKKSFNNWLKHWKPIEALNGKMDLVEIRI